MTQTLIVLTGKFVDPTNTALSGRVTFEVTAPGAPDPTLANILTRTPVAVVLDESGAFSLSLIPTDDPARFPSGGFKYRVTELIDATPPRTYLIDVPLASPGGTVDLSTLVPQRFNDGWNWL